MNELPICHKLTFLLLGTRCVLFYLNLYVNVVRRSWKYEKLMLLYGCNCYTEKRKVKILGSAGQLRDWSTECLGI